MAYLSQFKVGGTIYDLKDAKARLALWKLLGLEGTYSDSALETAINSIQALGTAAYVNTASAITSETAALLPTASAVKDYVDSQVGQIHSFDVVIDSAGTASGPSVAASASTMYKIYLVPEGTQGAPGAYVEWITIRSGEGTSQSPYTYAWEQIGTTETDLTGYVKKTTTIAGVDLQDNITSSELASALTTDMSNALGLGSLAFKGSASGTVTIGSQTVSLSNGTTTASGTINVTLKDGASAAADVTVTGAAYQPAGTVTISGNVVTTAELSEVDSTTTGKIQIGGTIEAPSIYVDLSTDAATTFVTGSALKTATWSGSSYTAPTATMPTLTSAAAATSEFAMAGTVVAVGTASGEEETLIFTDATKASAVTSANEVTGWTAGTFNAGNVTFGTFTTAAADTAEKTFVTGLSKASAATPVFTGSYYKVITSTGSNALTGTFSGTSATITPEVAVSYLRQAVDVQTFTGAASAVTGTVTFASASADVTVQ